MITDPKALLPSTSWQETKWGWTSEESLVDHKREARLCVATLLPFIDGKPDWDGFEKSVRWMLTCAEHSGVEVAFVLNADTGYIFQLSLELYEEVLCRFRALFPEVKMICGATAVGAEGEVFNPEWYYPHIDRIQQHGNAEHHADKGEQIDRMTAVVSQCHGTRGGTD